MESKDTPSAILLTRQNVPSVSPSFTPDHPAQRGAYVLVEPDGTPQAVIVATGSEVGVAFDAQKELASQGVCTRVVSMPSWFLFERQDADYRESVLPSGLPTLSIEAGTTLGWDRYADVCIGLDRFGASAPAEILFEQFGFTVENVVDKVKGLLS